MRGAARPFAAVFTSARFPFGQAKEVRRAPAFEDPVELRLACARINIAWTGVPMFAARLIHLAVPCGMTRTILLTVLRAFPRGESAPIATAGGDVAFAIAPTLFARAVRADVDGAFPVFARDDVAKVAFDLA